MSRRTYNANIMDAVKERLTEAKNAETGKQAKDYTQALLDAVREQREGYRRTKMHPARKLAPVRLDGQ